MSQPNNDVVTAISEKIDIPDSAYEKAEARYLDVGNWFGNPNSACAKFDPKITCQGSFRMGTVIVPLKPEEEYDLDLSCQLRSGYYKFQHSQKDLKSLVGADLDAYRKARQIQQVNEEKNRCWRLHYQDELKFHLDAVPCLPESAERRSSLAAAMRRVGVTDLLARDIADLSVNITDRTLPNYTQVSPDWLISNPDGYALWFESRMKLATTVLASRVREARAASIEKLPAYKWKTPLQQSIQILKRHRDVMFETDPEKKPISIIITTLAARAYQGESDIATAMQRILADMANLVSKSRPHVPNPVNPAEDFADKWYTAEGQKLQLELNFQRWVIQARADFLNLATSTDPQFIVDGARKRFRAAVDTERLRRSFSAGFPAVVSAVKKVEILEPSKPWLR